MQTDPTIDEKTTEIARLMTRILLGAEEGLPLFTIKIWVAQLARQSTELSTSLDELEASDLFTTGLSFSSRLSEEDAHWFGAGLEAHGKVGPTPDTIESITVRCTCGAMNFNSCLCGISPRDFTPKEA